MTDVDAPEANEVVPDHLYVCEYDGQETISRGRDVELWNEGLTDDLVVRRDLGGVVHSWTVTGDGVTPRRTDLVTGEGTLVVVPSGGTGQTHSLIVEDVDPTLRFPDELFTVSQIRTAAATADPDVSDSHATEVEALAADARDVADQINDGVTSAFEARYEAWRAGLDSYPEGTDYRYEIPLDSEWKRRVVDERTDLTTTQRAVLATAGFPASMTVLVDVETPEAVTERF